MKVTESLAKEVNVQQACAALAVPRASFYRWQDRAEDDQKERPRSVPPLALSGEEKKAVLEIRCLQPVRGGMDGGPPGTGLPGAETDGTDL